MPVLVAMETFECENVKISLFSVYSQDAGK